VGSRTCLDDVEKRKFLTLPGLKLRTLGRSARSQSLYRLRHLGSLILVITLIKEERTEIPSVKFELYLTADGCFETRAW
jgi:hypothetical protein